jgi:hypothetical protein
MRSTISASILHSRPLLEQLDLRIGTAVRPSPRPRTDHPTGQLTYQGSGDYRHGRPNRHAPARRPNKSLPNRVNLDQLSATAAVAASREPGAVLGVSIVAGVANVASPVSRLIRLEVSEWLRSAPWQRPMIPIVRVIAVIHVAIEAARSVKPGPGPKKYAAYEPIRPIVAVGRAIIRRVVEVPIGAHRRRSNVDAHADLSRRMCAHCADEARQT